MGKREFRLELQGLRSVASLLVAIYHIWVGRVSGGVDVFFVVSGYLITITLLRQFEAEGRLRFGAFWSRLVRRLFPAAFSVLLVTFAGALIILPKGQHVTTIREIFASSLFYENWQLAFTSIDYLDREEAASPLQHFWALAVQGQFYLAWPFVMAFGDWLARRTGFSRVTALRFLVASVFVASLSYSIEATARNQAFAYFDTGTRMWEFAMGAGVALFPRRPLPGWIEALTSWIGLGLILSCGALLRVSTIFPGYAALWPAGAAVLILISGGPNAPRASASRLLASRPLSQFGNISYAFYLWHWPLLVFAQVLTGRALVGGPIGVLIVSLSILLAAFTTYGLEARARSAFGERARGTLTFAGVWLLPVLAANGAWAGFTQAELEREEVASDSSLYPGAMALAEGLSVADAPIRPSPLGAKKDLPKAYADGCHQSITGIEPIACDYGDPNGATTLAIAGSSHAVQWLPALESIALDRGWRITTMTKSGCVLRRERASSTGNERVDSCSEWNRLVLQRLIDLSPEYVFTNSTKAAAGKEHVSRDTMGVWEELVKAGIRVLAIRDTPWVGEDLGACVEREGRAAERCARRRSAMLANVSPASKHRIDGVTFLDLTEFVCETEWCRPVVGNVLVYRDKHHLSATYVETLTPLLKRQIELALGEQI